MEENDFELIANKAAEGAYGGIGPAKVNDGIINYNAFVELMTRITDVDYIPANHREVFFKCNMF